jgi:hypothetical protein
MPSKVRVAVPVALPGRRRSVEGNANASMMVDLPVRPMPERERLERVAASTRRLRASGRLAAARFVFSRLTRLLPEPMHIWFARTVYGRRFLLGVVTNIPGTTEPLGLLGCPITAVYPLVPIAPETAFAIGLLGWDGRACVSVAVADLPGLAARGVARAMADVLDELAGAAVPR